MNFGECLGEGLIRKSFNAAERIDQSLRLGDRFLKSAENNLKIQEFEVCEIIAYNALFHFARSLLFAKGYLERSHACLFAALAELYPQKEELVRKADKIRTERHNLQYGGFAADKESASFVLSFSKEFGCAARQLLKRKQQ